MLVRYGASPFDFASRHATTPGCREATPLHQNTRIRRILMCVATSPSRMRSARPSA